VPATVRPEFYDASKLAVLQQVFEDTWAEVVRQHPDREPSKDEEVRTELAREIVAFASTGVSDPNELGRWALKSVRNLGLLRETQPP
jgi:hypothetical protein